MLDVLVALQVLGVVAGFQLLVHDSVGELRRQTHRETVVLPVATQTDRLTAAG